MFTTATEKRDDARIFAGSDKAHTATGTANITAETPALTPLMIETPAAGDPTGALVPWDGTTACGAVAVLALDHDGVASTCTYYKSGTFDIDALIWPAGMDDALKQNAFLGTAISVA